MEGRDVSPAPLAASPCARAIVSRRSLEMGSLGVLGEVTLGFVSCCVSSKEFPPRERRMCFPASHLRSRASEAAVINRTFTKFLCSYKDSFNLLSFFRISGDDAFTTKMHLF